MPTQELQIDAVERVSAEPGLLPAATMIHLVTQLLERKMLIAAMTGIAALAGVLLSIVLPERFTATTTILTPQQSQSSASMLMNQAAGSAAGPLASIAGAGLGLRNPSDLYVALLATRPVQDGIIESFHLKDIYHAPDMTEARKRLTANTKIVAEKSGLIVVSVTDRDKNRAAAMANAYTEQLRTLTKDLAVTEASQRRLFYDEQMKLAKEDLISAELAYQQVQQAKGLVQLDAQAKAMIEGLSSLRAQVAAKEVQVQALRSFSTDHNPDLQLAERERASLLAEESKVEQQTDKGGFARLSLKDVPGAGLEYLRAQHELGYRQTLYDLLIKQYDAARLDESKEGAVIQVVETAMPPDRRSSPHRALVVILFTMLGLLGAGAYLTATSYIRENAEISAALGDLGAALGLRRTSTLPNPRTQLR
jgi:tyrosine-protein kinase Etk/Wzc